jgi:rhodanese-related sulfurtransferase
MSSHHIVRDEQEPAVVIAESKKAYWPLIQQLLGWVPTVIVAEGCIDDILIMGIKIDIVICQEDNIEALKEKLQSQQPIKFLIKNHANVSFSAVKYLKNKGYKGVNIFGEFDIQKSMIINDQLIAIWHDMQYRYLYSSQNIFQKWVTKNHPFNILQTQEDQIFNLENLKNNGDKTIYISTTDGKVKISSDAPFWIGENLM